MTPYPRTCPLVEHHPELLPRRGSRGRGGHRPLSRRESRAVTRRKKRLLEPGVARLRLLECPLLQLKRRSARDTMSDMVKTGSQLAIDLPRAAIEGFYRRHGIRRASIFGSVLGSQFHPESDIDVLVEFEPGREPGLAFFAMQDELSQILQRKVDLNTPGFLSPYFRDSVLSQAIVIYDSRR